MWLSQQTPAKKKPPPSNSSSSSSSSPSVVSPPAFASPPAAQSSPPTSAEPLPAPKGVSLNHLAGIAEIGGGDASDGSDDEDELLRPMF